jgi:8-amino-7-oxononanoate synthase
MVGVNEVRWRNRTLLYFSGCDYFRLARHPVVASAAATTLKKIGLNVAASRLTTGNHKIYARLERELAAFFGAEAAVVFPDGYLAPMAAAQALAGEFTHAFIHDLSHAALIDAARMLNCPVKPFRPGDVSSLARGLSKLSVRSRPIVLTDGMFSHDGSVAPLSGYLKILPRTGIILVDDAHGAGVLGATGKGSLEHAGVARDRVIQCATLSKAIGAFGGVVLGARALREKILARSRLFAGSTPLPLPLAGAALAALNILRHEPARRKRLFHNASCLRGQLHQAGWTIAETPGPIIRLPLLNASAGDDLEKRLLAAGIYPPFVKYGKASAHGFFRFVISSEHTSAQLDKLAAVLTAFQPNSHSRRKKFSRNQNP